MKKTKMLAMLAAGAVMLSTYGISASATGQGADPSAAIAEQTAVQAEPVYGNTMGNIVGGGLILQDETYFYVYYGYKNCLYRTEKATGLSDKLFDGYGIEMNMADGKIYANNKEAGAIVEIDKTTGATRVIKAGNVDYMLAVDRELYYVGAEDQFLKKLSLDTLAETVLVAQPVHTMNVGKDAVYFALLSDNLSLYSVPRGGGKLTKLNNTPCYSPTLYQDKIYYGALVNGKPAICAMGLDGSGERVIAEVEADNLNVYGGVLFYLGGANRNEIYYLDLAAQNPVPVRFPLEASLQVAARKLGNFKNYSVTEYLGMNFIPGYLAVMCTEEIDGGEYTDEYIFDLATGGVQLLTSYIVDRGAAGVTPGAMPGAAQEKIGMRKAASRFPVIVTPEQQKFTGTYPPGNYKKGSVYGPYLSQKELNDVAGAVQAYLNSYDFSTMSEYEKVETAHDYLRDICEFAPDWRYNQANSAWGALIYREAQCSGYARAMKALCDAMGVECYYVHADGDASNPSHQWNVVRIDGKYYIIDSQGNDKYGFDAYYLLSDNSYRKVSGMSWKVSGIPACPEDYPIDRIKYSTNEKVEFDGNGYRIGDLYYYYGG